MPRRRNERDEVFVAKVLDVQPRIAHRLGDDRARELTLRDLAGESLRRTFGEPQRHARRTLAHLGHDHRHEQAADGADDAERCVPGLETLQHRQVLAQRLDLTANRPGPFDDPPAPDQELDAQLGFELADMLRHIGLDGVQPIGGGREASRLGDGQERLQLANIHASPPSGAPPVGAPVRAPPHASPSPIDTIVPTSLTDGLVISFTRSRTTGARGSRRPPARFPELRHPRS